MLAGLDLEVAAALEAEVAAIAHLHRLGRGLGEEVLGRGVGLRRDDVGLGLGLLREAVGLGAENAFGDGRRLCGRNHTEDLGFAGVVRVDVHQHPHDRDGGGKGGRQEEDEHDGPH